MIYIACLFTALLAAGTAASPAPTGAIAIGYRSMVEKEATVVNGMGKLYWDEASMPTEAKKPGQFGLGKSISSSLASWDDSQVRGVVNWFCYITADKTKFEAAKKAWIGPPLWEEAKVETFIKGISTVTASWNPKEVLRFGECGGDGEMLIPVDLLPTLARTSRSSSDPLSLGARCFASKEVLKKEMNQAGLGEAPKIDYAQFHPVRKAGAKLMARKACKMQ